MNYLQQIISNKKKALKEVKKVMPLKSLFELPNYSSNTKDFFEALSNNETHIIAEIKKASPSKGIIVDDFDLEKIASLYAKSSCDAISVLTEEEFFKGSIDFISPVKKIAGKPVLRKDFIFDEYQIYESKAYGADALLLITAILDSSQLNELVSLAKELKMSPLVEVHNEEELDTAIESGTDIIGINNRDLNTFNIDLKTTIKLSGKIPNNILKVSESGILTSEDINMLSNYGVDCFLVGESVLKSKDPVKFISDLKKGV